MTHGFKLSLNFMKALVHVFLELERPMCLCAKKILGFKCISTLKSTLCIAKKYQVSKENHLKASGLLNCLQLIEEKWEIIFMDSFFFNCLTLREGTMQPIWLEVVLWICVNLWRISMISICPFKNYHHSFWASMSICEELPWSFLLIKLVSCKCRRFKSHF